MTLITCGSKPNLGRPESSANILLEHCAEEKEGVAAAGPPVFDSQDELMKSVDVLEAGLVRHGEDDEETVPCPHVLLPHGAEFLLAGCVEHCQDRHDDDTTGVAVKRATCNTPQLCWVE